MQYSDLKILKNVWYMYSDFHVDKHIISDDTRDMHKYTYTHIYNWEYH